uniref:DNA-directed RNA polymerase III subunit RPC9 n=1 Tax=Setaria digitata TaxID=48799 RepID=A0A915PVD5_9BILA
MLQVKLAFLVFVMEVLDPRHAVMTNSEVFRLLQSRRKQQNELPKDRRSKFLGTVIYETSKYLQDSPAAAQRNVDIEKFIRAATRFKLTAVEILQLINLRPITAVEIQLIVEECEERLTEEEIGSLITIIQENLPEPFSSDPKLEIDDQKET